MSDKKNIDRLFQEKFKDFNPIPDDQLWERIENDLNSKEEKSRKIIPIWWRLGGIAAAIALLLTLGYNYTSIFKNSDSQLPEKEVITDIESNQDKEPTKVVVEENNIEATSIDREIEKNQNDTKAITTHIIKQNKSNTTSNKAFKKGENITNTNALTSENKKTLLKKDISPDTNTTIPKENTVVALDLKKDQPVKEDLKNIDKKKGLIKKESQTDIASIESEKKKSGKEKQSIFDAIKEKEVLTQEIDVEKINRWSLQPNVAPVYFSSITNGSPIGTQFENNAKSGNVNLSYGINVSYKVSKRLSIRSGLNKVNYGYNTNDITVTSSAQAVQAGSNINFSNNASNIAINPTPNIARVQSLQQNLDVFSLSTVPEIDGVLTQEFGYLEVPLEIEYRLIDKKLGLNLIGGVSSLFLTDNVIVVDAENFTAEIGEANNLSNTNFSTNIGIGVDYKISEKVQINVEPVFKYQLNTFSSDAGGFRPYSLGVYTGFNIKF